MSILLVLTWRHAHSRTLAGQHRSEENYFFKLTNYQRQLEEFLDSNPGFLEPASRRNEVLSWVKGGVRDFSISRANVSWGIPLPKGEGSRRACLFVSLFVFCWCASMPESRNTGLPRDVCWAWSHQGGPSCLNWRWPICPPCVDPSQTVYVWFDALNGYLTGLVGDAGVGKATESGWPASVHIIGKVGLGARDPPAGYPCAHRLVRRWRRVFLWHCGLVDAALARVARSGG